MTEPTSTAAITAAAISTASLALIGVSHYALLWAFVGVGYALFEGRSMSTMRAVIYVVFSTLIGAALGTGVVALFDSASRAVLIVSSLVGGYGMQAILARATHAVLARIDKAGGAQSTQKDGGQS